MTAKTIRAFYINNGAATDDRVTVRIEHGGEVRFGVGLVTEVSSDSAGRAVTKLVGVGPLGRRKA